MKLQRQAVVAAVLCVSCIDILGFAVSRIRRYYYQNQNVRSIHVSFDFIFTKLFNVNA